MSLSMEITLKRPSKVYHPGEILYGCVLVNCTSKGDLKHDGIVLQLEGLLSIQLSPRVAGLIDTFVNSQKPSVLHSQIVEVCKGGRFSTGMTELPFEVSLPASNPKKPIYETFHGNCINIQYSLRATMKKSLLAKSVIHMIEFIVEEEPGSAAVPRPRSHAFTLHPGSAGSAGERSRLPRFEVTGHLDSDTCSLQHPLTGEVCVRECSGGIISSIEIQLHRMETCGCPSDPATITEVSEVQGWQVCDGDVARGLPIPLCLPLPRAFTCATVKENTFAIEFQVTIVVAFGNDHLVTESFPLVLVR